MDDALRIINTILNLLIIPGLWILTGIRTEIATLSERLSGLRERVKALEDAK